MTALLYPGVSPCISRVHPIVSFLLFSIAPLTSDIFPVGLQQSISASIRCFPGDCLTDGRIVAAPLKVDCSVTSEMRVYKTSFGGRFARLLPGSFFFFFTNSFSNNLSSILFEKAGFLGLKHCLFSKYRRLSSICPFAQETRDCSAAEQSGFSSKSFMTVRAALYLLNFDFCPSPTLRVRLDPVLHTYIACWHPYHSMAMNLDLFVGLGPVVRDIPASLSCAGAMKLPNTYMKRRKFFRKFFFLFITQFSQSQMFTGVDGTRALLDESDYRPV